MISIIYSATHTMSQKYSPVTLTYSKANWFLVITLNCRCIINIIASVQFMACYYIVTLSWTLL